MFKVFYITTYKKTMFISNLNSCSFQIDFEDNNNKRQHNFSIQNTSYDELFGFLSFVDENVNSVICWYKAFVWRRLINETLQDRKRRRNLQMYNPYTLHSEIPSTDRIDDDDLFVEDEDDSLLLQGGGEEDDGKSEGDEKQLAITGYIKRLKPFCTFIKTVYGVSPRTWLEPHQRAFIFNALLFRILADEGQSSLERFVLAMTMDFLGFRPYQLAFVTRVIPKSYSVSIVQRGLGKTTIQIQVAAAAMLCLPKIRVLLLAQSKTMVQTTVGEIRHVLQKYNDSSKNLLRVPSNGLRIYMDYRGSEFISKATVVSSAQYSYFNDLVYLSGKNADGVRGQDPHLFIMDEFVSVPAQTHGSALPLGQRKHCHVNYLSSPVFNKPELLLNILVDLNNQNDINLYRTTFFCTKKIHQKHISTQRACINLEFYIPPYITYSDENRLITDVMTFECDGVRGKDTLPYYAAPFVSINNSSAYHNELGIVKRVDLVNAKTARDPKYYENTGSTAFSKSFYEFLKTEHAYVDLGRIDFTRKQRIMIDRLVSKGQQQASVTVAENRMKNKRIEDHLDFFIYVDPGYNAYTLSGIGITCVTKPYHRADISRNDVNTNRHIVTYMNHRFLDEHDLATVPDLITEIIWSCIQAHQRMFSRDKLLNFFIAVENNSNQAITAQVYDRLSALYARTGIKERYVMYLYTMLKKNGRRVMGYVLGTEKSAYFGNVINMSNSKLISFVKQIEQNIRVNNSTHQQARRLTTVESTTTIIAHFMSECHHFTYRDKVKRYSGKMTNVGSSGNGVRCDDTVVSYGLSNILCRSYSDETLNYKMGVDVYPWIKVRVLRASDESDDDEDEDDSSSSSGEDE